MFSPSAADVTPRYNGRPPSCWGQARRLGALVTLRRETLPVNDGWAACGAGTAGGSTASPEPVFIVHNRAELIAALGGSAPKITFVSGTIPLNVDDAGQPFNWNASYDNISLTGATNVWVDDNAFNDGEHPDSDQPVYFVGKNRRADHTHTAFSASRISAAPSGCF